MSFDVRRPEPCDFPGLAIRVVRKAEIGSRRPSDRAALASSARQFGRARAG
jgi:hypothetical protein